MSTQLLFVLGALHAAFILYLLGSRISLRTSATIVVSSAATSLAGFLVGMGLVFLWPDFDPLVAVAGATVLATGDRPPVVGCRVCPIGAKCRFVQLNLEHAAHPVAQTLPQNWVIGEVSGYGLDFEQRMQCFEIDFESYSKERAIVLAGADTRGRPGAGAFWLLDLHGSCAQVAWHPVSGPYYRWSALARRHVDGATQGLVFVAPPR